MQVLGQQHHGLHLAQGQQPGHQRLEGAFPPELRRGRGLLVALRCRNPQELGDQRHDAPSVETGLGDTLLDAPAPAVGAVVRLHSEPLLHQRDDGSEGAALCIGRAAALEPGVPLGGEPLAQRQNQTRFADAGLAGEQHGLALLLEGLIPAVQEQAELLVAADEGRQQVRLDVQQAAHARGPDHAMQGDRLADPLEHPASQLLGDEDAAHQSQRVRGDGDAVRSCLRLQAGGQVRGVAQGQGLAGGAGPHLAHHHRAGVDADAGRELQTPLPAQPLVQLCQGFDDAEPRPHRALGIVLVGLGKAEVHHHPVAQELGHVAVEGLHHPGGALLVATDHVAPVLGIDAGRQAGGVHQVTEEHRQLAALSLRRARGPRFGFGLGCLAARPCEDRALQGRQLLDLGQLLDQYRQELVGELELQGQGPHRDPAVLAQVGLSPAYGLEEAHGKCPPPLDLGRSYTAGSGKRAGPGSGSLRSGRPRSGHPFTGGAARIRTGDQGFAVGPGDSTPIYARSTSTTIGPRVAPLFAKISS